ncbi:MAG: CRISPR system precrRNA processing endoribonuclease RAMP protein Cas6, partial [Desulfobacterales bacterium]|nr:CRISPR system precrRNA processing endoribonuclease RAMP protein Cas6 [Desulfobacterales bacterium]
PLRLKEKGKLATSLTFPLFFQRLAQRLTLLSQFHGKDGAPPDLGPLLEKAGNIETEPEDLFWYDWSRYSGRQKAVMKFGGLRGKIRFKGELGPFLPWLRMGEHVNVGQNTSFGLGKYEMECS